MEPTAPGPHPEKSIPVFRNCQDLIVTRGGKIPFIGLENAVNGRYVNRAASIRMFWLEHRSARNTEAGSTFLVAPIRTTDLR
jgi:hypothetical protein